MVHRSVVLVAVALAVLVLPGAIASRQLPSHAWSQDEEGWTTFGAGADAHVLQAFASSLGDGRREQKAYVAVKYIVKPSESDDFEDAWKGLEASTEKEEGLDVFDLKSTLLDNVQYWQYGEWQSFRDFKDHLTSSYVRDFLKFLADRGIVLKLRVLEKVVKEAKPRGSSTDTNLAHVLVQYFVPPGEHEGFISQWEDTATNTWEEEGNRIYALRKTFGNNYEFFTYGTWDSKEDFEDHFKSDHVARLVEYLQDNDIVYFISPLFKVGDQPE